jgi:hypothetical protein
MSRWLWGAPNIPLNGKRGSLLGWEGGDSSRGVKPTIHLHLVPMLRMSGGIHLPHLYTLMASKKTTLPFFIFPMWRTCNETQAHIIVEARSHSREKRLLPSFCPSVCAHVSMRHPIDGFPWNFRLGTSWKYVEKSKLSYNQTKISGTLHEDLNIMKIPTNALYYNIKFLHIKH